MSVNKVRKASGRQGQEHPRLVASNSNLRTPNSTPNRRLSYRTTQTQSSVKPSGVTKNQNYHWSQPRHCHPARAYSWDEFVEEALRNHETDSGRDYDSSSSGSGSQSDTEDEDTTHEHFDHDIRLDYQCIRTDLIQATLPQIRERMQQTRYVAPPDDRLPPRSRYSSSDSRSQMFYEQMEDPKDPNTILVRKADGYYHLACPFYISDPTRHRKCLVEHDMQSIEDVIKHVNRFHAEPPYCPRCRQTFSRAMDRDRHFLTQTCEIRNWVHVEGVNSFQRTKLWKRDKIILGERKRWLRIWETAFPDTERPARSHYLSGEHEVKLSIARDYWGYNGKKIVSKFLSQNGYDRPLSEPALSAICRWALEDILLQLAGVDELTTATS
ncbi:unnamed protein product [Clonostachys rhizophaga]|uniref:C2H2-type domain-containing protein n=1 Tax=Clonostachys rhizophaga TaxID=160324 RepID=A0A9N9W4N9_9HYPO|nr:unnamed protein product [Clonostachys rhizophaga]